MHINGGLGVETLSIPRLLYGRIRYSVRSEYFAGEIRTNILVSDCAETLLIPRLYFVVGQVLHMFQVYSTEYSV